MIFSAKDTLDSHTCCSIQLKESRATLIGYATGFLIAPGLLMTNNHVFGKPADAANSVADFDFELDIAGMEREPVRFAFAPDRLFYTNAKLDYSLVAAPPVSPPPPRKPTP